MNKQEIQEAIERYNKRYQEHGLSEQALGWGEKGRAKLRFEILLSQWNFNQSSVLDFGCGFGGLLEYIKAKNIPIAGYTGIDINETFLQIARSRFGDEAQFHNLDLLTHKFVQKSDYILSSGVFNHKLSNNIQFINDCFKRFDEIALRGFAVNFLSNKVAYTHDYTYHADPAIILELAYRFSNNVVLRNDYMPFEFTIFVNKSSGIDDKYTVYNEYVKYV